MRLRWAIVVATAILVVTGCGGGGDASSSGEVRSAWRDAAAAAAAGDGTRFCALVTTAGRQTITSQTSLPCEDSVRLLGSRLSATDKAAIRDAKITDITVHGDDATVTYVMDASLAKLGFTGRTSLHRSSGHWLLIGV
jgi:hypothetical protein